MCKVFQKRKFCTFSLKSKFFKLNNFGKVFSEKILLFLVSHLKVCNSGSCCVLFALLMTKCYKEKWKISLSEFLKVVTLHHNFAKIYSLK